MEGLQELQLLWAILIALPGQVWLQGLYLFVFVGLLKASGVVRNDGVAAAANAIFAVASGGGFAGLADLNAALQVSAVAVIGAFYYRIWKYTFANVVNSQMKKFENWVKGNLTWMS